MSNLRPLFKDFDEEHPLNRYGYQVTRHGDLSSFQDLKNKFRDHLKEALLAQNKNISAADDFTLENYHNFIENHDVNQHEFISKETRILETKNVSNNEVGKGRTSIATNAKIPSGSIALPTISSRRVMLIFPNVKSMTNSICQKIGF